MEVKMALWEQLLYDKDDDRHIHQDDFVSSDRSSYSDSVLLYTIYYSMVFDTWEVLRWFGLDTRETLRWYGFDTRDMLV